MDTQEQPASTNVGAGFSMPAKTLPSLLTWSKVARTLAGMGLSPTEFWKLYAYQIRERGKEKPLPFTTRELDSFRIYFESRQSARSFWMLRSTLAAGGLVSIKQANRALDRYLRLAAEGRIPQHLLPVIE